jgi:hypothetical protein
MKQLLIAFVIFVLASSGISAQDVTVEMFRTHATELAKHTIITKTFSMIDEENNFHLYIDVTGFDEYYAEKPLEMPGHKVFFWKEGSVAFFSVEQYIRLVTIMQSHNNEVVYEFISQVDQKRFLIQSRFVLRNETWELADLRRTRIKMTKTDRKFKF